jgi:hypothetical protein
MKRDEREYVEDIPEATRKARLEEEAANLMSLPKEIRAMLMMKMEPVDMYMLYKAVDNANFKQWCDVFFWDYAFRQRFPDIAPPRQMSVNPRHRFFAHVLENALFVEPQSMEFRDTRSRYPDVNVEYENITAEEVVIDIEVMALDLRPGEYEKQIVSAMSRGYLDTCGSGTEFTISRFSTHYNLQLNGRIEDLRRFLRFEFFRLFQSGYGYRVVFFRDDDEVYRGIQEKLRI